MKLWTTYRATIEKAIKHQPRSLQRTLGPSQIGDPCDHCLAAALAGWQKIDAPVPWIPFIGTAIHAELEQIFAEAGHEWETETRVTVGTINDTPCTGTCDLFHVPTGTVIDHKTLGKTSLDKARRGHISTAYRVQAHAYGQGWVNRGHKVSTVAIAHLPRNAMSLDSAAWWEEPFNPAIVTEALERVTTLARNITTLQQSAPHALTPYIEALPRDPDCWNCPRYPDYEPGASRLSLEFTTTKKEEKP